MMVDEGSGNRKSFEWGTIISKRTIPSMIKLFFNFGGLAGIFCLVGKDYIPKLKIVNNKMSPMNGDDEENVLYSSCF